MIREKLPTDERDAPVKPLMKGFSATRY